MQYQEAQQLVYTPQQVAEMLQISKQTVYDLIDSGDIIAKKVGKVYRVPRVSLEFFFSGQDFDVIELELLDRKHIDSVHATLNAVRTELQISQKDGDD